jgi:hypothetical protein
MFALLQALQAPACRDNMIKVGGYILGEFDSAQYLSHKPRLA